MRTLAIIVSLGLLCQGVLRATGSEDPESGVPLRTISSGVSGLDNEDGLRCELIEARMPLSYRLNPFNWEPKARRIALGVTLGATFITALIVALTAGGDDPDEQEQRRGLLQSYVDSFCKGTAVTAGWIQETLSSVSKNTTDVEGTFQNVTQDACDRSVCGSLKDSIQVMRSYARVGLETTVQRLCVCLVNRLMGKNEAVDVLSNAIPETVVVPIGSGLEGADPTYVSVQVAIQSILSKPSLCEAPSNV